MQGSLALAGPVLLLAFAPRAGDGPEALARRCADSLAVGNGAAWSEALSRSREPDHVAGARTLFGRTSRENPRIQLRDPWPANGGRAVVPLSVNGEAQGEGEREDVVLLLFELGEDGWWFSGVDPRVPVAREWLFELGKVGSEATPELAMAAFLIALGRDDAEAAERVCTFACWEGPGENASEIFRTGLEKDIAFAADTVESGEERAVAHMTVLVGDQPVEPFDFYLVRQGEGWLIAGFGHDDARGARFLAGEVGPRPWPGSAEEVVETIVRAIRERVAHRVRAVVDAGAVGHDAPLWTSYRAIGAGREALAGVEVLAERDGRSIASFTLSGPGDGGGTSLWLELAAGPDGWRVVGATKDGGAARAFYDAAEAK